jgi:hypothetical protein
MQQMPCPDLTASPNHNWAWQTVLLMMGHSYDRPCRRRFAESADLPHQHVWLRQINAISASPASPGGAEGLVYSLQRSRQILEDRLGGGAEDALISPAG